MEHFGQIDEDLVGMAQAEDCRRCGGWLWRKHNERACWGLPDDLRDDMRRCSFHCHRCGSRQTVETVRFFGRRSYVALVFMLVNVLLAGTRLNDNQLVLWYGIDRKTLRRWRRWWHVLYAATRH